jgi:hypothetical protein
MILQQQDIINLVTFHCKTEGVHVEYNIDPQHRIIKLELSKNNKKIQVSIDEMMLIKSNYDQTNFFHEVIQNAIEKLNQKTSDDNVKNGHMELEDGWLAKELNVIRHNDFSAENIMKIEFLKSKAKELMTINVTGILAAGCFTSWYHQEEPRDYDIFIYDENEKNKITTLLTKFDQDQLVINDGKYLQNDNIEHTFLDKKTKIQYILVKYKNRKEIIDHFDTEHSAISYDPITDKLYTSESTLQCIKSKILKPHNNNKIAEWRRDKFIKKGFKLETVSV